MKPESTSKSNRSRTYLRGPTATRRATRFRSSFVAGPSADRRAEATRGRRPAGTYCSSRKRTRLDSIEPKSSPDSGHDPLSRLRYVSTYLHYDTADIRGRRVLASNRVTQV